MISEFSSAIQSVKVLSEILQAAKGLKKSAEIKDAVIELQNRLQSALVKSLAEFEKVDSLKARISDLEKEIAELKDWGNEARRYALTELCPGVVNFTVKEGYENAEPFHRLCASCFGKRQKGYLQRSEMTFDGTHYKCSFCDREFIDYSQKKPALPVRQIDTSGYG